MAAGTGILRQHHPRGELSDVIRRKVPMKQEISATTCQSKTARVAFPTLKLSGAVGASHFHSTASLTLDISEMFPPEAIVYQQRSPVHFQLQAVNEADPSASARLALYHVHEDFDLPVGPKPGDARPIVLRFRLWKAATLRWSLLATLPSCGSYRRVGLPSPTSRSVLACWMRISCISSSTPCR
jgi:hypothetical protein